MVEAELTTALVPSLTQINHTKGAGQPLKHKNKHCMIDIRGCLISAHLVSIVLESEV